MGAVERRAATRSQRNRREKPLLKSTYYKSTNYYKTQKGK
jgi:hypothetical protein